MIFQFCFHFEHRKSARDLEIKVGSNNLDAGGKYYQVERVIKHENYKKEMHANDIAVIRVAGNFEFNDHVGKIELSQADVPENDEAKFVGFGVNNVGPNVGTI